MEYTELNRRTQELVYTTDEFTFPCGCKLTVEINHFIDDISKREEIILTGVTNRYQNELEKHVCPEPIIEE